MSSRSTSPSWIASWQSTRAAAEHFWPAYTNADFTNAGTTSSRSASASTITQFLPPISAITRLRCFCAAGVSAATRTISWPTADHPARDRDREVPRRDHRDHPARPVAERVALAGDLQQRSAGLELDRPARVV